MRRNDAVLAPAAPSLVAVPRPQLEDEVDGALRPSIIITILVIATAIIVSATIFLLLRFISVHCQRRRRRSSVGSLASDSFPRQQPPVFSEDAADPDLINAPSSSSIIESLPVFTFGSVTSAKSGGDCAVCLSKFEAEDRLRLLPACCHAFHADCIDAWIASSHTCPLCRSSILLSESKILSAAPPPPPPPDHSASESFRVEIGSVSRRRLPSEAGSHGRSYSIGSSFDYILDDSASEVAVASTRACRRPPELGDKSGRPDDEPSLAAEVANGGERLRTSWLKDYVDRMGGWTPTFSLSSSLRSSGRFFLGSSRTSTEATRALEADLEASRLGDEISEMFRWLSSGV